MKANRPRVTVNYVEEFNRISRPADFDPNENAAPYFEKAYSLMSEMPAKMRELQKVWPGDMNESDSNTVSTWVRSNSELLAMLRQGLEKRYYWVELQAPSNDLMRAGLAHMRQFRTAGHLLCAEAKMLAQNGQAGAALEQLCGVYRMGTFLAGPKLLIEQLVGIAVSAMSLQSAFQVLERTSADSETLGRFQKELGQVLAAQPFLVDFTGERLIFYDQVQRLYSDDGKGGGVFVGQWRRTPSLGYLAAWMSNITVLKRRAPICLDRRETVETCDKMYGYLAWAAEQPPYRLHAENVNVEDTVEQMTARNLLLNTLASAVARVLHLSYRVEGHTDGLLVTTAILRYKGDTGRYPENLQELVTAGYFDELSMDVFSGKPLVYKLSGDGFQLYSFAHDFDDDGGEHDPKWADDGDGDYVFWPVQ